MRYCEDCQTSIPRNLVGGVAGAVVNEALAAAWDEAMHRLAGHDPELAAVLDLVSPVVLGLGSVQAARLLKRS
jgi:hypothetical protein